MAFSKENIFEEIYPEEFDPEEEEEEEGDPEEDFDPGQLFNEFNRLPQKYKYLAKAPIEIQRRPKNSNRYSHSYLDKGAVYLAMSRDRRLWIHIIFHNSKDSVKVVVSKWYLLQLLLCHLSFKPILPMPKKKLWFNTRVREIKPLDLDKLDPVEVQKDYYEALQHMREVIPYMSGEAKEKAQKQLENLLNREWQIDLIRRIQYCKEYPIESDPEDIKELLKGTYKKPMQKA